MIIHNLEEPLTFLADAAQDGAACALVQYHLGDRLAFLGEVHRALRPGGGLLLSWTHPAADTKNSRAPASPSVGFNDLRGMVSSSSIN